jgi:DNA polymerase-3 subunit beta
VEIGFNAQYLLDFLRSVDQAEVELHFKDANSAGEVRPHAGAAETIYRYVVMPMRI